MSKVLHFKPTGRHRQTIDEKACWWVVRLSDGASEAELRELHAWLDQHPAHVEALLAAACMWDRVSVLSELSDIFPLGRYVPPSVPLYRRFACVAAVAGFTLLLLLQTPLGDWAAGFTAQDAAAPLSYETRIGEQITITLLDGSTVILNTNSRVEVVFGEAARDIHLQRGEAHFTVVKDPARPFRVHARGGMVEAVGTAFTVQHTLREGLEVTVLEGEVNFTPLKAAEGEETAAPAAGPALATLLTQADPIALSAGETVEVGDADDEIRKLRVPPTELESRLAWRHGMLLFQGDPLDSVIREVSRYTSIRIEVDEAVRDIPVLGYFRTGDIEGILLTMQDTFHIKVERLSDEHIVLKSGL